MQPAQFVSLGGRGQTHGPPLDYENPENTFRPADPSAGMTRYGWCSGWLVACRDVANQMFPIVSLLVWDYRGQSKNKKQKITSTQKTPKMTR
jgi:hypothetical protein